MRLGLAYNERPDSAVGSAKKLSDPAQPPSTADAYVEWDEPTTIEAVARALRIFGDVVHLEAVGDFATRLAASRIDLLFNMAEGHSGPNREAQVPAIAEFLGIRYTGSDPLALAVALHKARAKDVLAQRGVPTAPFVLVEHVGDLGLLRTANIYPAFLKPVWEGSSKGISQENYVETPRAAMDRAAFLLDRYRQPVLAETYLPGHEFTVAILGNDPSPHCLPTIRFQFDGLPAGALPVMGYEAKWLWDVPESPLHVIECPAAIPDAADQGIQRIALAAYRALGCRDWARVDVRLDAYGAPHVIEVNPLPGIIPDLTANSCFPNAAHAAGIGYDELIQTVTRIAWRRLTGLELEARAPRRALAGAA